MSGVFTPVLAKHSKSFWLIDCISVGVDRMQRNFEPMGKQVEAWQSDLTDVTSNSPAAFTRQRSLLGRTNNWYHLRPNSRISFSPTLGK